MTARLSRKFYETFGEDVTNELVDWFNSVDATYRGDLRELNELNFGRFDAKLEQRLTELDAQWDGHWTRLDAKLEQRLAELDGKWEGRWARLDAKLDQRLAELKRDLTEEISRSQRAMLRWMFTFWLPTAIGIIGTAISVALFLRK